MPKPPYQPRPLDTQAIRLPEEILALCEPLARNVHENWAAARLREGWRHGPRRDDIHLLHPCLVPYDELPDAEKEYDRITAMETLKTIIALGYSLRREDQPT